MPPKSSKKRKAPVPSEKMDSAGGGAVKTKMTKEERERRRKADLERARQWREKRKAKAEAGNAGKAKTAVAVAVKEEPPAPASVKRHPERALSVVQSPSRKTSRRTPARSLGRSQRPQPPIHPMERSDSEESEEEDEETLRDAEATEEEEEDDDEEEGGSILSVESPPPTVKSKRRRVGSPSPFGAAVASAAGALTRGPTGTPTRTMTDADAAGGTIAAEVEAEEEAEEALKKARKEEKRHRLAAQRAAADVWAASRRKCQEGIAGAKKTKLMATRTTTATKTKSPVQRGASTASVAPYPSIPAAPPAPAPAPMPTPAVSVRPRVPVSSSASAWGASIRPPPREHPAETMAVAGPFAFVQAAGSVAPPMAAAPAEPPRRRPEVATGAPPPFAFVPPPAAPGAAVAIPRWESLAAAVPDRRAATIGSRESSAAARPPPPEAFGVFSPRIVRSLHTPAPIPVLSAAATRAPRPAPTVPTASVSSSATAIWNPAAVRRTRPMVVMKAKKKLKAKAEAKYEMTALMKPMPKHDPEPKVEEESTGDFDAFESEKVVAVVPTGGLRAAIRRVMSILSRLGKILWYAAFAVAVLGVAYSVYLSSINGASQDGLDSTRFITDGKNGNENEPSSVVDLDRVPRCFLDNRGGFGTIIPPPLLPDPSKRSCLDPEQPAACPPNGVCRGGVLLGCVATEGLLRVSDGEDSCVPTLLGEAVLDAVALALTGLTVERTCGTLCSRGWMCSVPGGGMKATAAATGSTGALVEAPYAFRADALVEFINRGQVADADADTDADAEAKSGVESTEDGTGVGVSKDSISALAHYFESQSVLYIPGDGDDSSGAILGLTSSYVHSSLPIPPTCFIRILLWEATNFLLAVVARFVTSHPLIAAAIALLAAVAAKVRRRRKARTRLLSEVPRVRELAYDRLALFDDGLGYASLHLRDEIAHDLYPSSPRDLRYLCERVWPCVVAEIRRDNRIRKGWRDVGGRKLEWWEWISEAGRKSRRSRSLGGVLSPAAVKKNA